jgi:23S rRNA (cytosine1962-C5)-methyltransferase
MAHPELYLKKNEDKRLRKGHLWVFSNEVDSKRSPLDAFSAGDMVLVKDSSNQSLGSAYINPNTLICARLISRKPSVKMGGSFFKTRISNALALREHLFDKPFYRLVFGESDGLPGLVIDRFGSVLSVQITTAGIEKQKAILINTLIELFSPDAIILKNENSQRQLENLSQVSEVIYGTLPDSLVIEENNTLFQINVLDGQKTGWFYDHRDSRARTAKLCKNKRVLDLFSYSGAWAIPAAVNGASEVTCVDSSESALALAQSSAKLNNIEDKMQFVRKDVFDFLKKARENNEHYDVIVLDPPALIKRKKDFKAGYQAYHRLNQLALQVLAKNGLLISASCSHHLTKTNLHELLRASARHIDRHMIFFANGSQGPDHPIHPAIPETEYLKTYFCSVSNSL